MKIIPNEVKNHYSQSLLGRLKLIVAQLISGSESQIPAPEDFRHFILTKYKKNSIEADILRLILSINVNLRLDFSSTKKITNFDNLIRDLLLKPFDNAIFIEVNNNCLSDIVPIIGTLISCKKLDTDRIVYSVALIDEKTFPADLIGYAILDISKSISKISYYQSRKFKVFNISEYYKEPLLIFVMSVLEQISATNSARSFANMIDIKGLSVLENSDTEPPIDPKYDSLIKKALKREITCTNAIGPLVLVEPYDLDFCFSFPRKVIDYFETQIGERQDISLAVYWDGKRFVMSDDYALYLLYRKLNYQDVPLTILGEFPITKVKIKKVGGPELLPPIGLYHGDEDTKIRSLPPTVKNWFLDQHLSKTNISDITINLYALYIRLSKLITNSKTPEKDIHKFLEENPVLLDPNGVYLLSEVRFGNKYRADLIIQTNFSEKQTLLIELERANIKIFTKSGRPSSKVTHAIQQVEDWLRWWKENPAKVPKPLDSSISPDGLVVIGRNDDFSDDDKKRLSHLNQNRLVKVITYDDLLDKIENLIKNLERLTASIKN